MTFSARTPLGLLTTLAFALSLVGCPRDGKGPSTAGSGSAAPLVITVTGVLRYEAVPAVKSVKAFLGVEFEVFSEERTLALSASSEVSRETLIAAAGKTVEIRCVPGTPTAPHPEESAPVGADGEPMSRPAQCKVKSMKIISP